MMDLVLFYILYFGLFLVFFYSEFDRSISVMKNWVPKLLYHYHKDILQEEWPLWKTGLYWTLL